MTVQQIVNYPFLYINGAQLTWVSGTTINVSSGLVRSSTNILDMNIGNFNGQANPTLASNSLTLVNAAIVGLNGIDTGALAASTFYYVFVIADSTGFRPTGALMSLSATMPTLPFGYDSFRRVGQVLTSGASAILLFTSIGNFYTRTYQYDAPIVVVNGLGSTTPVTLSLATAVPVSSSLTNSARGLVTLSASFTAATAANSFSLRPTGGTAFPVVVSAPVVSQAFKIAPFAMNAESLLGVISIDYETTAAGDALTLNVVGYVDYV